MRTSTDWFRVICDITAIMPLYAVSDSIEVPRSTILGWKQGAEPKHKDGERLIDLWCSVTGCARDELPIVTSQSWWSYHL